MKKFTMSMVLVSMTVVPAFSQLSKDDVVENWDGIEVLIDSYGRRISPDGTKLVGETMMGTTYYDTTTGTVYFYDADFGRGNVVANNGWIVGNQMIDDAHTRAVVMSDGKVWYPDVFNANVYGNIHGITPDGSRICGVIGNNGRGATYLPYVCDIDADGNFGPLQMLPAPKLDCFNQSPQYASAVWISADGKTVAGQVIDARGVFVSPIIYRCDNEGKWSSYNPAESLFNPYELPLPAPLGELEDVFKDAPFPDIQKYMTPEQYEDFEAAILEWNKTGFNQEDSPYEQLWLYMDEDKYEAYIEAEKKYLDAVIIYNEMMEKYWLDLYEIADTSVFFVRNAMALSPDGKWLAMSAQVDEAMGQYDYIGYYVPYMMNLETGEAYKIGKDRSTLVVNQVMNDGTVLANTLPGDIPANGYIYNEELGEFVTFYSYVNEHNPAYGEWMKENLTGEAATGLNPDGSYNFMTMTVTGVISASDDFSVICGGVDGYNIGKDMYLTYILNDVSGAGVESLHTSDMTDGTYRVYNLQGMKVMDTKEVSDINSLAKGIYIVNGKKVAVR